MAIKLEIEITVDDKGAVIAIRRVGDEAKRVGEDSRSAWSSATRSLASYAAGIASAATVLAGFRVALNFIRDGIHEAAMKQEEFVKLNSVFVATGNSAGFTARQMQALAQELQQTTRYGDEQTMSAMAMLATFQRVSGDAFPRTIRVGMDLATVMGTDLRNAVFTLGKALEDPANGLTMLRRAGVIFTDSQRAMIQSLEESGRHAEAMGIILDTVSEKVGGAAVDSARTYSGQLDILKNAWADLKAEVGSGFINDPVFLQNMRDATTLLNKMADSARASVIVFSAVQTVFREFTLASAGGWNDIRGAIARSNDAMKEMAIRLSGARDALGVLNPEQEKAERIQWKWTGTAQQLYEHMMLDEQGAASLTTQTLSLSDAFSEAAAKFEKMIGLPSMAETFPSADQMMGDLSAQRDGMQGTTFSPEPYGPDKLAMAQDYYTQIAALRAQDLADELFAVSQVQAAQSQANAQYIQQIMTERAMRMDTMATAIGGIGQLIGAIGRGNKAAFLLSKAFAVAQIWMNEATAELMGMATTPYYMWAAVIAQAKATAIVNSALVAAQTFAELKGQAHSGLDYVPSTGTYLLERGEAVIPAYRNVPGYSGGAAGNTTNITFGGVTVDSPQRVQELAEEIVSKIERGHVRMAVA